jgi:hypothetical protein
LAGALTIARPVPSCERFGPHSVPYQPPILGLTLIGALLLNHGTEAQ